MLTIHDLTHEHFELVARWLAKPEINRWLTAEWRNPALSATLIAIAVRNRKNRLFLVRCDSEPCGLVALANINAPDNTAAVWYVLGEQTLSGRGIISEAVIQIDASLLWQDGARVYLCLDYGRQRSFPSSIAKSRVSRGWPNPSRGFFWRTPSRSYLF
jgi:RimJ/RimL family protein N-acetyltransferase